jgi:hypothetical protein
MRRLHLLIALASALLTLSIAAPAALASNNQVIADCNSHGQLTQTYTASALQNALSTMPGDIKEYTNCYDVVQRALLAQIGSHHGGGGSDPGSGGSSIPTPLIIVLVFVVLAAASFGVVELRRRRR